MDIKPRSIKQMSAEEKIDLAADAALDAFIQIGGSNIFLSLASTNPEKFLALLVQFQRLQLMSHQGKTDAEQDKSPAKIQIEFVKPVRE